MTTKSTTAIAARPHTEVVGIGTTPTLNKLTDVESVVDDTWVPALPTVSLKSMVNVTLPSLNPDVMGKDAVQSFPLTLVTVTAVTEAEEPLIAKATVDVLIVSSVVNERVTVSPIFAISFVPLFVALSESIDTLVRVGAPVWNVAEDESVVDATWVPALPSELTKSMVKATVPSVSPDSRVNAAVHSEPILICAGVCLSVVVPSPSRP
jgi:hypothetical protein